MKSKTLTHYPYKVLLLGLAMTLVACSGGDRQPAAKRKMNLDGMQPTLSKAEMEKLRFNQPLLHYFSLGFEKFEDRLEELQSFEYQNIQLKKKIASMEGQLALERSRVVALKSELGSLKEVQSRTLASIEDSDSVFQKGIKAYQANDFSRAIANFDNFLSVKKGDRILGPKALLWKGLSHARLKEWGAYQKVLQELQSLYPSSAEARLAQQQVR